MAFIIIAGRRGVGKTALAVKTIIQYLYECKDVWVDFPLDLRHCRGIRGKCFFADDINDLGDMRNGLFVLDEAHLHASARDWKKLTTETHAYLSLSRHIGMDLIFISQNFRRLDSIVRELADRVYILHKVGPVTWWTEWLADDLNEEGLPKEKARSAGHGIMLHTKKIHKAYDDKDLVLDLLKRRKMRQWKPNGVGIPPTDE